ncbi:MAG: TonB-dependent receptor [Candidatus Latescibacteria bacterium]|nr:TonB-dependent receptor [Candidatus Latescibacterota bacterium]
MFRRVLVGVLISVFLPLVAMAGTTGKLAGLVKDKETGVLLPAATISLVGTTIGTATDRAGQYVIINIPPGPYTVRCTYVGYQEERVLNIHIIPDFTTTVNFALTPTVLATAGPIEVVAERPIIQKDVTQSVRFMTAEDLQQRPIRGYQEAVATQAGVVNTQSVDNPLNIRGGRANEIAYLVDGFVQQDPLFHISNTQISSIAIQEIITITGGFNAEYGRANSGVVNVVTKEGGEKYSGTGEYVTDELTGGLGGTGYGYNLGEFSLGGPVLPGYKAVRFFGAATIRRFDDYRPSALGVFRWQNGVRSHREKLPHQDQRGQTIQGKLSWKPTSKISAYIGYLGSTDKYNEFVMDDGRQFAGQFFKFDLDHADRRRDRNDSFAGTITGVLNPKTFVTLEGNYYRVKRRIGDASLFDLPTDSAAVRYSLNGFDTVRGGPFRTDVFDLYVLPGDATHPGASPNRLLDRKSEYVGFKGSITSQVLQHHEVKAGVEWQQHDIDYYNNGLPWSANARINAFYKTPRIAAGYVQDKIEYASLTVNAGLRWDYLDANTPTYADEKNPLKTADKAQNKTDTRVSPRLGIGFPISDKMLFHFSYGKFFQPPDLFDLYIGDKRLQQIVAQGTPGIVGNPNLKAENTTAYEVGVTRQLSDNMGLDITTYFKDTANLINVIPVFGTPGTDIINRIAIKDNSDFGTVKGIDVKLERRRQNYVAANVAYTLSYATGTGSGATDSFDQIFFALGPSPTDVHLPKVSEPLSFDQRHTVVLDLDIRGDALEGKPQWVRRVLANAGANLQFIAGSGLPYTPTTVFPSVGASQQQGRPIGRPNSARLPWQLQLDMKLNKVFRFGGLSGLSINAYAWVLNVTNRTNIQVVYPATGRPDEDGFLASPAGQQAIKTFGNTKNQFGQTFEQAYRDLLNDPGFYGTPRQIRLGVGVNF